MTQMTNPCTTLDM